MPLEISSCACASSVTIVNGDELYSSRFDSGNVAVPDGVETDLIDYTVPAGDTVYLSDILCSGNADGEFRVYQDSTRILEGRLSSSQRFFSYSFSRPYKFTAGEHIKVKVIQHTGSNVNYWAYIYMSVAT